MEKLVTIFLLMFANLVVGDPVAFKWAHNPEPDLVGYRLYWTAPDETQNIVVIPAGQNRVTVDMPPFSQADLTAFDNESESLPTVILTYRPVIIDLVIQHTPGLEIEWNDAIRIELFRKDETLFKLEDLDVWTELALTRTYLDVNFINGFTIRFMVVGLDAQAEFFRAYVARRP